jgi:hypothetical protein
MATATPQWESPVEKVVLPKFRPVPLFVELRAETVGDVRSPFLYRGMSGDPVRKRWKVASMTIGY